ncbi:MAG: MFS transporter [Candidatus Thorarchaeota archaeon]|nr:MFS transporter [Candidatus Thorarchaeota archaeon]
MLTRFQKIYFGMARLGPSIMLDMLDLASALFYFSIQSLPALYTGSAIALSYLSIMASELTFGNLSDRTKTKRWGRRKPFIMIGAPLMALSFLLVFSPHWFLVEGNVIGLFFYATITMSLFKVFYGMTMTPFQSWMPELTEPEERPAVSSWQNVANFIGFVVGTFGTSLLAIESIAWGLPPEILYMILAFIVIQLLGFTPSLVGLHKEGKFIPQPSLRKDFKVALEDKDYVGWLVAQGLISVGIATIVRTTFPYINDYLTFSVTEFLVFGVELLSVVFVFFIIYQFSIRKKGKRFTLQLSMMLTVISLPFTLVITTSTAAFLLLAFAGAGVAGYYLFPYIIYADFAHKNEIMTGEGRAGFYTSFPSIPLNGMNAFSAFLWGVIFALPEIVPVPGETTFVTQGYLLWGPIAAVFLFLAVLVLFKVNIDPDFKKIEAESSIGKDTIDL